jgi:hypothetical protein
LGNQTLQEVGGHTPILEEINKGFAGQIAKGEIINHLRNGLVEHGHSGLV